MKFNLEFQYNHFHFLWNFSLEFISGVVNPLFKAVILFSHIESLTITGASIGLTIFLIVYFSTTFLEIAYSNSQSSPSQNNQMSSLSYLENVVKVARRIYVDIIYTFIIILTIVGFINYHHEMGNFIFFVEKINFDS